MPPLRVRHLLRALAAFVTLAAAAPALSQPAPAPDQDAESRPPAPRRTVAFFDFEERTPDASGNFNPDPVPRHWFRAQDAPGRARPNFPAWNTAVFDHDVAASGSASVRLEISGGSASLRLMPGAVPVFPGADYAISALVRTEGLTHARAVLAARFLDAARRPIPASETRSEPLDSPGQWTHVAFDLRGDHPDAAFLQIDLELLQPREFAAEAAASLGKHAVLLEDVQGRAWFDDVAIFQVPRVSLGCDQPGNIVLAPDRPTLRFSIHDLVGQTLTASLNIVDERGQPISSATIRSDASGRDEHWTPDLERFGWYRASLVVSHDDAPIARAHTEFLWLPAIDESRPIDAAGPEALRRWGLVADHAPPGAPAWPDFAPHAARAIGAGFIVLPHADPSLDPEDVERILPDAAPNLDKLLEMRQDVGLCFAAVPDTVAADLRIDPGDTLLLGRRAPSIWLPHLAPILSRYGQRITRWQIGSTPSAFRAPAPADLAAALAGYRAPLTPHTPTPILSAPVPIIALPTFPRPAGASTDAEAPQIPTPLHDPIDAVTLTCPLDVPPSTITTAMEAWRAAPGRAPELTIAFEPPPPTLRASPGAPTTREALDALVKHAAEYLIACDTFPTSPAPRAAVAAPWIWTQGPRPTAHPQPHLAVWRTILDHLAGRSVVTELPAVPGVRCMVLGDPDVEATASRPLRGALLAWNESAATEIAPLTAYFGEGPLTIVDIFGNTQPARRNNDDAGTYTIPVGRSPIFIEGVDPRMVRFLASFRIEPPFARAVIAEHEHALVLDNPWPIRVTGQLQIVNPDPNTSSWTISPRGVVPFSIAPGGTERIPISFAFGAAEESGRKHFSILVKLTADRTYPPQLLTAPLDIGSEDLDFVCEATRHPAPDGPDVVVTATVTNRGQRPRTLRLDAVAPGLPSQQFAIGDLAPGEQTTRRFVFKNAGKALAGRRIHLSLSDIDVPERLNTSVRAPE